MLPALLVLLAVGSVARAQTTSAVTRVEEDWQLVVGSPDATIEAPQITCLISPLGDLSSLYAILTLNHQTQPDYVPGGLQLQLWKNYSPLWSANFSNNALMQQAGETVNWTTRMTVLDGTIHFRVVSANSSTWGDFSSSSELRIVTNTSLSDLNSYSPDVSAQNSGISYASNLVNSLVLQQVRYYSSSGQLLNQDTQARVVFQQDQN
jgi:hypothetical protein